MFLRKVNLKRMILSALIVSLALYPSIALTKKDKHQNAPKERFIDNHDGTVTDTKTNLMWAAEDNARDIFPEDAASYCKNYRGGGNLDWRMPYQDELAELYDADKSQEYMAGEHPIHVATDLIKITTWGILAEVRPQPGLIGVIGIPTFCFGDGKVQHVMMCGNQCGRVLPVRSIGATSGAGLLAKAAKQAPEEITLKPAIWPNVTKPPVKFAHKKHSSEYKVACNRCHHVIKDRKNLWKEGDEVQLCEKCHTEATTQQEIKLPPDQKKLNLKLAFHNNCQGCHRKAKAENPAESKVPTVCQGCHMSAKEEK
jgi:hypothetical protein